jgi:benzodiazapine receptor
VSRRGHIGSAGYATRDPYLVCRAHQAVLDTAAIGVPDRVDCLYILMGISFWRLWESEPVSPARSTAMVLFLGQLALNAAWSPVFFGWHGTRTALLIIATLLLTIGATIVFASRVDRVAAWLLGPHLAWVAYASTINAGVVVLN